MASPPRRPPGERPARVPVEAARRALALDTASSERRRRLTHRLVPAVLAVAVVALVLGIVVGSRESVEERVARTYVSAWQRGNYPAMYRLLTPAARDALTLQAFVGAHRAAADTATAVRFEPGRANGHGDSARVPVRVATRIFGTVDGTLTVPVKDEHVDWRPEMAFPGLRPGERLTRRTRAPERATILARGGGRIVTGPATARRPGDGAAASIAGSIGPPETAAEREALYARGFDRDARVGRSGLERALEVRVAGRPGGELLAGARTIATSTPRPSPPVRSTIDLKLQAAADEALGGRFGGITALEPRTGEIRALAGIAFSAPQPPGSTFKMVTTTAALEARAVKPSTPFPVETHALIDGVPLENANGESCGGTFLQSFAQSCNSVFAPLGVKLGARRLVDAAERFGFNRSPGIAGAAPSTIPPAAEIDTPLAVGSTAIGQGKVLATPLEMALIASTIANGGVRHDPVLVEDAPRPAPVRVTPRRVAATVERLMIAVVRGGTGTAASLGSVSVAGKTGTAELRSTVGPTANNSGEGSDTDAWFAAYAPTRRPKVAVGVLFVKAGAGGATAAPAARVVLAAGVKR
jgi:hypothetical protein